MLTERISCITPEGEEIKHYILLFCLKRGQNLSVITKPYTFGCYFEMFQALRNSVILTKYLNSILNLTKTSFSTGKKINRKISSTFFFYFHIPGLAGCLYKWSFVCVRAQVPHWLIPSALREKLQPIAFQHPLATGCTLHWWDSNLSPANRPCLHTTKLLYRHTEAGGQRGNENDTVWPCTKSTYIWNANMLMLTFSLLLWGLVVQTCDGGREVNDEIMHSGDVYVSVLECHRFFLSRVVSLCIIHALPFSPRLPIFN